MMRGFSFTACVLLCLALSAYSLKCRYCLRDTPESGCDAKVNLCFSKPGQKCISITLYEGDKVKYRLEGCTNSPKDCSHRIKVRRGTLVKTVCCNRDLCNLWMGQLY